MNWRDARFRRLLWTIPATLVGSVVFGIYNIIAETVAERPIPWEAIVRLTLVVHAAAWTFFIAPFAWVVPEKTRLYDFPFSPLLGAALGVGALLAVTFAIMTLQNLPVNPLGFILSRFAVGCALSGGIAATFMSLAKILSGRMPDERRKLTGE